MTIDTFLLVLILATLLIILWRVRVVEKYFFNKGTSMPQVGEEDEYEDELFDQALSLLTGVQHMSTSYLQRKLGIGYARAARLIDMLEEGGYIGVSDGANPRKVLKRPQ